MAVLATSSITLAVAVDVARVDNYYLLQSSTATPPTKPNTANPSNWLTSEPNYDGTNTNTLYVCQKTTLTDGTFYWSAVSKSSSYEAAKQAANAAAAALDAANSAVVTKTMSGERTIVTTDAADLPLLTLSPVYGESVQDGTPTPDAPVSIQCVRAWNLIEYTEFTAGNLGNWVQNQNAVLTANDGSLSIACGQTDSTPGAYCLVTLPAPGTYFFSLDVRLLNSTGNGVMVSIYTTSGAPVKGLISSTTAVQGWMRLKGTGNVSSAGAYRLYIFTYGRQDTSSGIEVKNLVLSYGAEERGYAPYGCIPIVAEGCGKNLFDPSYLLDVPNWTVNGGVYSGLNSGLYTLFGYDDGKYPIESFETGARYTISFHCTSNNSSRYTYIIFRYTDGSSSYVPQAFAADGDYAFTSEQGKTLASIGFTYGDSKTINLSNIQLERGSSATAYEPYRESVVYLDLKGNELHGLNEVYRDILTIDASGHVRIYKRTLKLFGSQLVASNYGTNPKSGNTLGLNINPSTSALMQQVQLGGKTAGYPWPLSTFLNGKTNASSWDGGSGALNTIAGTTSAYPHNMYCCVNASDYTDVAAFNAALQGSLKDEYVIVGLYEDYWHTIGLGYVDLPQVTDGSTVYVAAEVQPIIGGTWWTQSGYSAGQAHVDALNAARKNSAQPFVVDEQTAATRWWRADCPDLTELRDGQQLTIWLSHGHAGSTAQSQGITAAELVPTETVANSYDDSWLNLTLGSGQQTGWIPLYYGGSSRMTNHYGVNNAVHLTYKENAISGVPRGWWGDANYDTNDIDNRIAVFAGKTGSKGIWANSLFMEDGAGTYQNICTASDGTVTAANRTTATTKKANTNGFKVGGTVYYTNTTYAANTNISGWGVVYSGHANVIDARYSFNAALTANFLTPYKPIYLVGTVHSDDGLYYLDSTTWWTQTPNNPQKVYVLVGSCYDSTTSLCRFVLYEENPWYIYDEATGKLVALNQTVTTFSNKYNTLVDTVDEHTTKVGKIEAQINGHYATCPTAAGTAAKVATIDPAVTNWTLYKGAMIAVKFTYANTAASPTLNVNSTGAKGILSYKGSALEESEYEWEAGATIAFVYNGSNWLIQDDGAMKRLSSAESAITQTAESIISTVSSTYVTKASLDTTVTDDVSFLYRAVSETEGVTDGVGRIQSIRGNTIVWNQLFNSSSNPSWNSCTVARSNRTYTITSSNLANNAYCYILFDGLWSTLNHVYLVVIDWVSKTNQQFYAWSKVGNRETSINLGYETGRKAFIQTSHYSAGAQSFIIGFTNLSGSTNSCVAVIKDIMYIDLTLMFGAGNEPATVAEFEALYPNAYYPYNAGEILPVNMQGVETVGRNLCDISAETAGYYINSNGVSTPYTGWNHSGYIPVIPGKTYTFTPNSTIGAAACGAWYSDNIDTSFISSFNSGPIIVTAPSGARYVRLSYRNTSNNVQFELGSTSTEYEPYWEQTRDIPASEHFPTGIKSAGAKYDELYRDKAITRIGSVDLGTLSWNNTNSGTDAAGKTVYYAQAEPPSGMKKRTSSDSSNVKPNIVKASGICLPPKLVAQLTINEGDYTQSAETRGLYVFFASAKTSAQVAQALNGVMLYYELAAPTETPIDPPLNMTYKVSASGTERIMVDEEQPAPQSAPVPMTVKYGMNVYEDVHTALSEISQNAESIEMKVSKDGVISSINQSSEEITIDASRVNISGAAIFTSGRLSESSLNTAYDAKGSAATAKSEAISSANNTTDSKLGNYSTTTAMNTAIGNVANIVYNKVNSRSGQLVTNGNGAMGDNTNFSVLTYDPTVANGSPGSFTKAVTYSVVSTDEFIPVDTGSAYYVSFDAKSDGTTAKMYGVLYCYDIDKNPILAYHHMFFPGSTTTLARELKAGDTKVYLTSVAGFNKTTTEGHQHALIFWCWENSAGYQYPTETYSRYQYGNLWSGQSSFNTSENSITLTSAWSGPTFPAGTSVSQNSSGANYPYFGITGGFLTTNWVTYKDRLAGYVTGLTLGMGFRAGTAYIKIGWLWNYGASNGNQSKIWVTNVIVKEDSVAEEQMIYISKVSGTSSVSQNTTWVTTSSDSQNTWTVKRPTYSSSHPVLFVAKQCRYMSGKTVCTTPLKDDTTTVIDGGHVITGKVSANNLDIVGSALFANFSSLEQYVRGVSYIPTLDSTVQSGKTYYQEALQVDYVPANVETGESVSGLYERYNGDYVTTSDTVAQEDKAYYSLESTKVYLAYDATAGSSTTNPVQLYEPTMSGALAGQVALNSSDISDERSARALLEQRAEEIASDVGALGRAVYIDAQNGTVSVGYMTESGDFVKNHVEVNSDGFDVYYGSSLLGHYGETMSLGPLDGTHVVMSGSHMGFADADGNEVAYIDVDERGESVFYMTRSVVVKDMFFGDGKWKFYKRPNNNMGLKWMGD